MKVILIRDETISADFLEEVRCLLSGFTGPLQFEVALPQLPGLEQKVLEWDSIFSSLGTFVDEHQLICDFTFLVTAKKNQHNFFGYISPKNLRDGFVHGAEWSSYLDCPEALPVAYHILALIIQRHMFENEKQVFEFLHSEPVGCVNDFCENKSQIILKMRTGDICSHCMERLITQMPLPLIHQMMELFESLRVKMLFSQNMKQFLKPSKLLLTDELNLLLPEFSNLEIRLRPLEKVLYALFYKNPEGIFLSDLIDHKNEMILMYRSISGYDSLLEMDSHIGDLCNITNNSANEKLSRIKRVIEEHVGKRLAENYIIAGGRGERKRIKILNPTL